MIRKVGLRTNWQVSTDGEERKTRYTQDTLTQTQQWLENARSLSLSKEGGGSRERGKALCCTQKALSLKHKERYLPTCWTNRSREQPFRSLPFPHLLKTKKGFPKTSREIIIPAPSQIPLHILIPSWNWWHEKERSNQKGTRLKID